MKKKILALSLVLFSLLAIPSVRAGMMPCPIGGEVIAVPPENARGLTVQMIDSPYRTYTVNEFSEFQFDVGDVLNCNEGMTFNLAIKECQSDPACRKTAIISGGGARVTFDLTHIELPCPPCICPEDVTPYAKCDSCCPDEPEPCPECPDVTIQTVVASVITFLLGMGAYRYGFGLKIYTKRSGEIAKLHKHKNIRGYHEPNTLHRYQAHPRGELNPEYSDIKNKDGRYNYIG